MTKDDVNPVITIDGPGGSGKGTISRLLADKLNWHFLDSGAIYRAAACYLKGTSLEDKGAALANIEAMDLSFSVDENGETMVLLSGRDVTADIRSEAGGEAASKLAEYPEYRQALLEFQRAFAKPPGLVADGRDMGTVVFPHADVKIFLTACLDERVKRRYKQLKEKGIGISIDALLRDMAERDQRDATRKASPLIPADDAYVLDCSTITAEDTLREAVDIVRNNMSIGV